MRRVRIYWFIVAAVTLATATVSPLREQVGVQWRAATRGAAMRQYVTAEPTAPTHVEDCIRFVQTNHPDDPAMLTAAGCVAEGADIWGGIFEDPLVVGQQSGYESKALELLRRGTEAGGGPTAWAAYANALARDFRGYPRVAETGYDPTDPEGRALAEEQAATRPGPTTPPEQAAAPLLRALHEWERADPSNGLPVAMEAGVLYGLRRDSEALQAWVRAAELPAISTHIWEVERTARGLFIRMGFSDAEATVLSFQAGRAVVYSLADVRSSARVAVYEGRTAMMRGRGGDAVRLWDATMDIGKHLAQPRGEVADFLQGNAIAANGAVPSWVWRSDESSGLSGGPLDEGRYFWGKQHPFYVSQAGNSADEARRDEIIRAKLRGMLVFEAVHELSPTRAERRLAFGTPGMAFWLIPEIGLLLLSSVFISLWGPERADAVSSLRTGWNAVILLLMVIGILPGLLASLVAARWTRTVADGVLASWSHNLRRALVPAAALGAMLYLACSIGAVYYQVKVTRSLDVPGMTQLIRAVGPSWTNPAVPPDSWRAAYPPTPAGR